MSQAEGAQPSLGMGWVCGKTGLVVAEPLGKLVGIWGIQWCPLMGAEGSIMGISNWVLRGSRNPNSRDQVSEVGAKAQDLTGSEYVHSFDNVY